MKMKDWIEETNTSLKLMKYDELKGSGTITRVQANNKAEAEYDKYKVIQDKKYISDFDELAKKSNLIINKNN